MQMELIRVTDPESERLKRSLRDYAESFPCHEQREAASQAAILADPAYHFAVIVEDGADVGSILYWETAEFLYIEHIYVYSAYRGRAYGSAVLRRLRQSGKTVILEIDPPVDEASVRRKRFYERNGFVVNPYAHVHSPYHRGDTGHSLVVLSSPVPLTPEAYGVFDRYLRTHIMADAFL